MSSSQKGTNVNQMRRSKQNPSGSPLGKYSLLNQFIKGVDKLTGHKRKYK